MTDTNRNQLIAALARDLNVRPQQVDAAVTLMDEGATVPFIARYRKEVTGGLDDTQLRLLEERLSYRREMEIRRAAIVKSIQDQGKMTDALALAIAQADSKAELEDLYLPYKVKRRTKAMIAREAGLEPLADALLANPTLVPEVEAAKYIATGRDPADLDVPDATTALEGARQILMERFAEDATLLAALRQRYSEQGLLISKLVEGKANAGAKFSDYFDHSEPFRSTPSHRALAMLRGRREEVLTLDIKLPEEVEADPRAFPPAAGIIAHHAGIADKGRPADKWLLETARWCWRVKLAFRIEGDLMQTLFERAEEEAIRVFAANLRDLLLAAPAGPKAVLGLDPGFRTGVKVAVVDTTGKLVETTTIYPHEPQRKWNEALMVLGALVVRHNVELIAIGNGTASRETDRLVVELLSAIRKVDETRRLTKVMVSEAGASVYSASELAAKEFPDLDVSLRGAVSIARRLQDPLAELVKIEPKAIGVGQYQHDLTQSRLARALDAVVEDCVNAVGVDLNTASVPLLTRVSGLGESLARAVVAHRDAHGPFETRADLLKVSRLGPKAFEQCAGFLRIRDGAEPLDASAIHPEAYPLARRIAAATAKPVAALIGDSKTLRALDPRQFVDDQFGLPTVQDILREFEKPGRDPRPEFKTADFAEGVESIDDLRPGMILEGVVTNVAAFGAFIDIGVHQDGLVHVSALSDQFVKDPREVVRPGQVVKVKVMEVDKPRNRIGLSLRLGDEPGKAAARGDAGARTGGQKPGNGPRGGGSFSAAPKTSGSGAVGAFAAAFAKAKGK